jgi:pilus assembly protein Flp/PilA
MNARDCLVSMFIQIRGDRRGVTALEYGLIALLVAMAIFTSVGMMGTNLAPIFTTVAGKV